MFIELVFASLVIVAVSLIGIVTIWNRIGNRIERNLNYLVSFASGVFLVLFLELAREVVGHSGTPAYGLMWIAAGAFIAWILVKLFPETHHHGDTSHELHNTLDARKLIIGDAFHNIGDGVLLAAAFITSSALGFAAAASIIIHELIQELSEFFVLRRAGYTTKGALNINVLTSSTILIGSVGGFFLLEQFSTIETPVLGIAAGALLALLLQDLIPHSLKYARMKGCAPKHFLAVAIGVAIMIGVFSLTNSLGDHSHEQPHQSKEVYAA